MFTSNEAPYVDFYDILGVEPEADMEVVHRVYRILATRFHPDNSESGNIERFLAVKAAYEVLGDPQKRKNFDAERKAHQKDEPIPLFMTRQFSDDVHGESNRRLGVLCLLYNQRKQHVGAPSLSVLQLENMMCLPREHLTFTVWYLKQRRLISSDDKSSLMITVEGMDILEAAIPKEDVVRKLLKAAPDYATAAASVGTGERYAV
ncbi:MAG: J domain-containing protein [Bryobacteraceae bacterium]